MTDIEKRFNKAMMETYTRAKDECGYNAARFLQMLSEIGGVATAKSLILKPGGTDGFARLWELHRLDLSVEALVLKEEFNELFSDHERDACMKRLEEYGWDKMRA